MTPPITPAQVADLLISRLDDKYDLIYIDRGDQLTDEQVAAMVAGDTEKLWDSISEWESDARWYGIKYVIGELVSDLRREYEDDEDALEAIDEFNDGGEDRDHVCDEIAQRDSGQWFTDLVNATPDVLLRICCIDEDHAFAFQPVDPPQVLGLLDGIEMTDENLKVVADALLECSPEFSVLMGYWVVGADLGEINNLPVGDGERVQITNPYLYLGNPFAGSGWISEEPLIGTVTVDRDDLRTDKGAFGWSLDEVYGGLSASRFSATLTPVPTPTEPQEATA